MKFKCPTCEMQLKVEPEMAGKIVRCPGCNSKLQIPGDAAAAGGLPAPSGLPSPSGLPAPSVSEPAPSPGAQVEVAPSPMQDFSFEQHRQARGGWEEADPANPNPWM